MATDVDTDGRIGIGTKVRFFEDGVTWEVTKLERFPGQTIVSLLCRETGATCLDCPAGILQALQQVRQPDVSWGAHSYGRAS